MDVATIDREDFRSILRAWDIVSPACRLGARNAAGKYEVSFGKLYDATQDIFEALAGTLKAAKKRHLVDYSSPLLLKGTHDKVAIVLLVELSAEDAASAGAGHA